MNPRSVSIFHKLPTDEIWHFYAGDPLRLMLLFADGSAKDVIMGGDPLEGSTGPVCGAGRRMAGGPHGGGRAILAVWLHDGSGTHG